MATSTADAPHTVDASIHALATPSLSDGPALELFNETDVQPTSHRSDTDKTLNALLRAVHRLGGLRDALRATDDAVLAYANTAYRSIHDRIVELVDDDIGAELCRLTCNGRAAGSCTELRLALTQLYAWAQHVTLHLEAQRAAEQALNASFAALATSVVEESANGITYTTGLYL